MFRYTVKRALQAVVTLWAVSVVGFFLTRLTGDPLQVLLGPESTPDDVARVSRAWGLDRPLVTQYLVYLGNLFTRGGGESLKWTGSSAGSLLVSRLPATLELAGAAIVVCLVVALPLGVLTAVRRGTLLDRTAMGSTLLGQSMPTFWLGIMLMWLFSVELGWLPTSGIGDWTHLVLPAVTMGLFPVAALTRLLRSSMLEVLDTEYVKLARIKGLSETLVIWKHCLRNAALAPVTYFGLILASLVSGSVVAETVFAWPGVGLLSIEAVQARDFPVVQTVVMFFALVYVVMTFVIDLLYGVIDPRIRAVGGRS
ncbi:ABC transporter permease [Dactylosporangium sp. CA-092794]|uniref:ABC transporter permease n=1 Tax=Dactylosporangium sp. CA-092794 TaxID=3239929 RepID=UPI003D89B559